MAETKVLMVASEVVPFAKTGGLADVTGALPKELAKLGAEVRVAMPKYKKVDEKEFSLRRTVGGIEVPVGRTVRSGSVSQATFDRSIIVYFLENDSYFGRDGLYGTEKGDYPDNDERFTFFCRGVLEMLRVFEWKPEIIHCHDWHTAVIPTYLKTVYSKDPFFKDIRTVFTIHNLGYQGKFPRETMETIGLGWEQFTPERLEFYGQVNFMKAGLVYSDALTTVSEKYSREIQSPEFGCGLEGVLQSRKDDLFGILNGLDYGVWNPATDEKIAARFSLENIGGKQDNKVALLESNSLPEKGEGVPLIGMISRLADQKGLDILAEAIDEIMRLDVQLIILGTGEEKYHILLEKIAEEYPEKMGLNLRYDDDLAHLIYAGSDIFLMPSRYEPCGLGQLISLKYGTIPLVHETGGLADTIEDFDPKTGRGNGFVFNRYSSEKLLSTLRRAVKTYQDQKTWRELILHAMKADFSWRVSAQKYLDLYNLVKM